MLKPGSSVAGGLDLKRSPAEEAVDSPNSAASSFQMEFSSMILDIEGSGRRKRDSSQFDEKKGGGAAAAASDDDETENGLTRKKLRLSKQQSAFLEDSFKHHPTLTPVSQRTFPFFYCSNLFIALM